MKFYNIINQDEFDKLTIEEKYALLISKNVFTKIKSNLITKEHNDINNTGWAFDFSFMYDEITYLGEKYYMNIEFYNEVFEKYEILFDDIFKENLEDLKIFEVQLNNYPENELIQLRSELLRKKRENLYRKLIFEFNEFFDWDDSESHKFILKKYLVYDLYGMYQYLVGNFSDRYYLDNNYKNYLQNESKLFYINEFYNCTVNKVKGSLPKKIALLESIEFFKLEKIKILTDKPKHNLIAFLFGLDNTNENTMDSIRRNIASLNEFSNENPSKYTAHKHVKTIYKEVTGMN